MHRGHAGPLEHELQGQIEVRRVHAYQHVRRVRDQTAGQTPAHRDHLGESAEGLEQSHHRQPLHGIKALAAGRLHLRSGNPCEGGFGTARL